MNYIYNKVKAILLLPVTYYLLPAFGLLCSCESREQMSYGEDATQLSTPSISVKDAQHNSLTFRWEPVADAIEYGYKLYDADGNLVEGGTTKVDTVKIEELTYSSDYTFHLYAYAKVIGDKTTSQEGVLAASTTFWPAVSTSGTYTSSIVSSTTKSWGVDINEDRTNVSGDAYGTFTVSEWYNHSGYDLQFTVNADSTINVLNGTRDESIYVKVLAGASNIKTDKYARQGVQIDESKCRFDRTNQTLRIYSRSVYDTSVEGFDELTWD